LESIRFSNVFDKEIRRSGRMVGRTRHSSETPRVKCAAGRVGWIPVNVAEGVEMLCMHRIVGVSGEHRCGRSFLAHLHPSNILVVFWISRPHVNTAQGEKIGSLRNPCTLCNLVLFWASPLPIV